MKLKKAYLFGAAVFASTTVIFSSVPLATNCAKGASLICRLHADTVLMLIKKLDLPLEFSKYQTGYEATTYVRTATHIELCGSTGYNGGKCFYRFQLNNIPKNFFETTIVSAMSLVENKTKFKAIQILVIQPQWPEDGISIVVEYDRNMRVLNAKSVIEQED